MLSRSLRPTSLLIIFSAAAATAAACGGSSSSDSASNDPGATAGSSGSTAAGKGGTAGSAGKAAGGVAGTAAGGTGGKAGASGASGASAKGGSSGNAGASGAGGASGGSGASGSAGKAGSAGGSGASGSAGKAGSAGTGVGGGGSAGSAGAVQDQVISLVVIPASATIDVVNGVSAPLQLAAKPVYKSGMVGAAVPDAVWSIKPGDRASVDANGRVLATGTIGGDATVTATWKGFSGDAIVTIKLSVSTTDPAITPADKTALDGATMADGASQWIYPYDKTVFPRGLLPPEMMWSAASANDKVLVSIKGPYVTSESYFVTSTPNYTLPVDVWNKVAESGKGGPVDVKVARIAGGSGAATLLMKHTWTFASGSMRGTVYYWSNNLGRIVRIKAGAAAPDDFLAAAGVNDGCTTCHAVSANGNVLVIGGGVASGDSAASVFDLLGNKLTSSNYGRAWAMPALTPNGTFAALNEADLPGPPGNDQGGIWRVSDNTKVSGTGADSVWFDMPAFSPDGSKLVFVDHNTKALAAYDYAEPGGQPTLTNYRSLVAQGGSVIAFPSVSPDGKWGVYHRGPLDTRDGQADLYLANVVSGGAEIPLDALNGVTYPFFQGDRDRHWNFEPTFAPVPAGGYFWVVFTARRTYGNKLVGGKDATKQLWVAAVDLNPTPGKDPSHPAFRVPGQDDNLNMRGFWALDPCKDDGKSCAQSSECCGGACLSNGTCGQPPGQTCKPVGTSCSQVSDCCGFDQGFQCINSHCTEPKP